MLGSILFLLIAWAFSYWKWGVPYLWTNQPEEWEALIAQVVEGGPEDWETIGTHYSGRPQYQHRILDVTLAWDGAAFPIERYTLGGRRLPLSRAGRLAILRSGLKAHRHYEAKKAEALRLEVAKKIIKNEKPQEAPPPWYP